MRPCAHAMIPVARSGRKVEGDTLVEFLLRLVICLGVTAAGFAVLVARSSSQHREMLFLAPLFGFIPASLAAALLFVPIERFASSRGLWATPAVVLAGASLVFLFEFFVRLHGPLRGTRKVTRTPFRFGQFVKAARLWIILGAMWGALWRASALVTAWTGTPG